MDWFLHDNGLRFERVKRYVHKNWSCGIRLPADNYMFKVNKNHTTTRYEICSKLKRKTPVYIARGCRYLNKYVYLIIKFAI